MVKRRLAYLLMLAFFLTMWIIGEGARKGTDDRAQEVIMEGNSGYRRWFTGFWNGPDAGTEKFLFAMQGVAGCAIGGYCLYKLNRKRDDRKS